MQILRDGYFLEEEGEKSFLPLLETTGCVRNGECMVCRVIQSYACLPLHVALMVFSKTKVVQVGEVRGVSVGSVLRASHRFQGTVHDGVHVPRTVRGRGFWVLHSQVLQWRFVIYLFDCLLDKRRSGIAVNGMGSGEMMKG